MTLPGQSSNASDRLPLVVILGPTASGKTALAIELATWLGAEVIGADSRQIYRGMDIGTAKPSLDDRAAAPHHLIDIVDPDMAFGLGQYLGIARQAIDEVRARDRIPMLVGGSGQYVWAVIEGWNVPAIAPNAALRALLEERARVEGADALHDDLTRRDPEAARAIHPRNVRRVIRALELLDTSGDRASAIRRRQSPREDTVVLGLSMERPALYQRIDRRVDDMFKMGLVEEVQGLLASGYDPSLPSMSGIGYTQVVQMLRGEITQIDAAERIKTATHRFCRQQSTWFRGDDPRISWLAPGEAQAAVQCIAAWRERPHPTAAGALA
jgi:tRNA dimethylallyltransferase